MARSKHNKAAQKPIKLEPLAQTTSKKKILKKKCKTEGASQATPAQQVLARSTELPVPKPAPLKLHCKQNHFNVAQVYMQTKTHAIFYAIWA
jgi:hypothetical protein